MTHVTDNLYNHSALRDRYIPHFTGPTYLMHTLITGEIRSHWCSKGARMNVHTPVNGTVTIWVETSSDGATWTKARELVATEFWRDCTELRAILASYTSVVEAASARHPYAPRWIRLVMQGAESGTIIAVVPRRWDDVERRYVSTGGEWMVADHDSAYEAWYIRLARRRLGEVA